MNTDISFELDQVLTQETRDGLNNFATAGLQAIDYTTYINQITSQISTLAVDSTISTLEGIRDNVELISVSTGDKSWEQSENFFPHIEHSYTCRPFSETYGISEPRVHDIYM